MSDPATGLVAGSAVGVATGSITVRGGTGGLTVGLADLTAAASWLRRLAGQLLAETTPVSVVPASPTLLGTEAFVTARSLVGVDLVGTHRVLSLTSQTATDALACTGVPEALALTALAVEVDAAVRLYRAAEATATAVLASLNDQVMAAAGRAAPVLALGAASVAVLAAVTGADVAGRLDEAAADHPWLVDLAAGGADGFVTGLAQTDPAVALVLVAAAVRAGVPFPPRDSLDATAILAEVGSALGALDEPSQAVTTEVVSVGVGPGPSGVADLARGEVELGTGADGEVRVIQVPQPDGTSAWVVQLPGTQEWGTTAGPNPFDLSTDIVAMTGAATAAAAGATRALDEAMARAGRSGARDPVMLVGHSQGGILAASLASDPRFREGHEVRAVLTFGAPVGAFDVPEDVEVLSVEHVQDLVPRLDGAVNPDRAGWTTVRVDLGEAVSRASQAHDSQRYAQSSLAIDRLIAAGHEPSLTQWAVTAAPFLSAAGPVAVTDVRLRRDLPSGLLAPGPRGPMPGAPVGGGPRVPV